MEPKISVGILHSDKINFELLGDYKCSTLLDIQGEQSIVLQSGKILCNNQLYDDLYFSATSANSSFTLKDVVIGINFHWERKENQRFQGDLKIIVHNNQLVAINVIPLEDYLISVISSEMSATASLELLKAHAVISRSWLLAQLEKNKQLTIKQTNYSSTYENKDERIIWYDREDHIVFDVCADDHCQRYQGITRTFSNINIVKQAIDETRGEVLVDDQEICDARFSKCCGGVVEEFQNCWEDIKYPYLVKLRDDKQNTNLPDLTIETNAEEWILTRPEAFCNTQDKKILNQVLNNYDQETTDFYRWRVIYTVDELSDLVKQRSGIDFGTIESFIPIARGTSGRLIKLKIVGSKRTMIIGKELEIRRILSKSHLYSSAFVVEKIDNKFIFHGAGWGHGVGLCQIGAAVMGEQGYNYSDILLHYYVGASIDKFY